MRKSELTVVIEAIAEQSYSQLEGDWRGWLEVARIYERKVPSQDRLDIRHDILLELYRARQRDKKPIPILRAYRIASLTVALYWRERNKSSVKVCVFNGYATERHCKTCQYRPDSGKCAFLGVRPVESLEGETRDNEGHRVRLLDTVATDKAIDMPDQWTDLTTWLLGCPTRLIVIALKKLEGKPLTASDRMYLMRYRRQEQKKLF